MLDTVSISESDDLKIKIYDNCVWSRVFDSTSPVFRQQIEAGVRALSYWLRRVTAPRDTVN